MTSFRRRRQGTSRERESRGVGILRAVSVPPAERLVFESAVEGLFLKALGDRVTPALRERLLREAHIDLQGLEVAYPLAHWERALEITAQTLYPAQPLPTALEHIGEELTRGFFETLIGRALHGVLKLIGPRRTLLRTERNLRSGNNYTECTFIERSPTHLEMVINEGTSLRHVTTGLVREGLLHAGAKNPQVTLLRFDADTSTWDVRWD